MSSAWINRVISGSIVIAVLAVPRLAAAQVWDVSADWSDINNPNGPWSYRLKGGDLLPPAVLTGGWNTPQPSWGSIPGCWFRSNGAENVGPDWIAGDVVTHTRDSGNAGEEMAIRWTSPIDGWIAITGSVWWGGVAAQFFRANDWSVQLNGVSLTGGAIGSGSGRGRSNPVLLSEGSGGTCALNRLRVHPGDQADLAVARDANSFGGNGAYTPVTFVITTIPPPGDFNHDGPVNIQDIFDFLAAWFNGDLRTDFNCDGAVTQSDIFKFLAEWFQG